MSFQIGDTVGDYQIIGVLGAGGMGKVYKVKNQISDRIDAVKVLLPDLAEDPELADRFTREIKVLASLNHPNIAGLRTAFRMENQLLMVMEFVEGTTLDDRAKAGPIPLEDSISYILQALSALGYAHKRGVIHRDIKPANMMLTPENVIKLMDFGIAKSKSDKKLTQTGTTMGSLFYMSAEQVQGNELDGRSDLYSVGISLYELVTGSRPFSGKSDFDIMIAQLQQAPMPPIQMMPDLPKPLNDIIMISLEKDPAKRFQTAEAFSAALGSITPTLRSTPVQASAGAAFASTPPAPPASVSATGMMSTVTTPGPPPSTQPMAVGGMLSPPPPYIPTGMQPTVMAPQPADPAAATLPPPEPFHGVPPPSAAKGYRGLYMALGALIVLAILVVAGIEVPRYLKTHASANQTAQATSTAATPSPAAANPSTPDASAQPQAGAPGSTTPSASPGSGPNQAVAAFGAENPNPPPAASGAATGAPSGSPATPNPVIQGRSTPNITNKPVKNVAVPSNPAAEVGQVVSPPTPAATGQVAPPPAANNDQIKQELAEIGELHDKLSIRAVSVNEGVDNLRKQMSAGGNNLRSDIGASQARMKMYMDKFDAAMNAGDPVAAKKYMGLAEHEVETLEKFLGH